MATIGNVFETRAGNIEALLTELERWQFGRRVEPRFRATCRRVLTEFFDFVNRGSALEGVISVTTNDVRTYLDSDRVATRSYQSQRDVLRSIAEAYSLLVDRGMLDSNPADGVPGPTKAASATNEILDPVIMGRIFRYLEAQDPVSPLGIRDEVIVCLLYCDHLLLSEAMAIRIRHLNLAAKTIELPKGRIVEMSNETRASIAALVSRPSANNSPDAFLLTSRFGMGLSHRVRHYLMGKLTEAAGVPINSTRLRKSGIKHRLDQGETLQVVRQRSGHPSSGPLQQSEAIDVDEMFHAFELHHPRHSTVHQGPVPQREELFWSLRRQEAGSRIKTVIKLPGVEQIGVYLKALNSEADDDTLPMRYRVAALHHAAISELVYSSGLTPMSLAHLKRDDIDLVSRSTFIETSHGRRKIPVTETAATAIDRWLAFAVEQAPPSEWVFPQSTGRNSSGHDLSARHRSHVARLGLPFNLSDLRRLFAFHIWQTGFDERYLAYMLGLSNKNGTREFFRYAGAVD